MRLRKARVQAASTVGTSLAPNNFAPGRVTPVPAFSRTGTHPGEISAERMQTVRQRRADVAATAAARDDSYAGWTLIGALVGFIVIGVLAITTFQLGSTADASADVAAIVPSEAAFELTAHESVEKLLSARPVERFTSLEDVPAYEAYMYGSVLPVRAALTAFAVPERLKEINDKLVGAMDRYVATLTAAATCMSDNAPCPPQRHDLRDAASDIATFGNELRAATGR